MKKMGLNIYLFEMKMARKSVHIWKGRVGSCLCCLQFYLDVFSHSVYRTLKGLVQLLAGMICNDSACTDIHDAADRSDGFTDFG